jgi:hypothetical protein
MYISNASDHAPVALNFTYATHREQLGSALSQRCFRSLHEVHTLGDLSVNSTDDGVDPMEESSVLGIA